MRSYQDDLDAETVKQWLLYDPQSGLFTWRQRRRHHPVGSAAGAVCKRGYVVIGLLGKTRKAHRLAWAYVYGEMPAGLIDHIDGNKSNNRIDNLRVVTNTVNMQNLRAAPKGSASGKLGVHVGRSSKWRARIIVDGARVNLGSYETPEEAHQAYIAAKRRLHPGCAI